MPSRVQMDRSHEKHLLSPRNSLSMQWFSHRWELEGGNDAGEGLTGSNYHDVPCVYLIYHIFKQRDWFHTLLFYPLRKKSAHFGYLLLQIYPVRFLGSNYEARDPALRYG